MELQKILDSALKQHEMKADPGLKAGYKIDDRTTYPDYLSNDSWKRFYDNMEKNYTTAYDGFVNGDGKELEERKVGKHIYPPKMASFGSSSRMIYELMKDDKDFRFEKQLPTTVGGTANLDGFSESENGYIFVEAKCREPYAVKSRTVGTKYKKLYEAINESDKTGLHCEMEEEKADTMKVTLSYDGKVIRHFDMKQMISHLLGIGTAFLNGKYEVRNIHFLYLLFNPTRLAVEDERAKNEIESIYTDICKLCAVFDFKALFTVLLDFLQNKKGLGKEKRIDKIADGFRFQLCDQDTFEADVRACR